MDTSLASTIEHTLLTPTATPADIEKLCREAISFRFAAVCVTPVMVRTAVAALRGTDIPVASVANFPLGTSRWSTVFEEIRTAVGDGAGHIDLVLPLAGLVESEPVGLSVKLDKIRTILSPPFVLKCIVEFSLLDPGYWARALALVSAARANYLKTGTGFFGGVTVDMIQHLRAIDQAIPIKASGGIRTASQARELLAAGASRLGSSQGVTIAGGADPD